MTNKQFATITSGEFKNKKILIPPNNTTRSSKNILRESFFNSIRDKIYGSNFIEMFAGSGAIGITAISEGANMAYFIEKDKNAFLILKNNLSFIENSRYRLINGDSFAIIGNIIDSVSSKTIIYLDPPFSIRENNTDIYEKCFSCLKEINNKEISMAIFEHMSTLNMPQSLGLFNLIKTKKFGKSSLSYYEL
jgi:16S rRNA (guanine(966)-N(2))-methyltransferase RsmD